MSHWQCIKLLSLPDLYIFVANYGFWKEMQILGMLITFAEQQSTGTPLIDQICKQLSMSPMKYLHQF